MPKNTDGTFTLCGSCATRGQCAGRNVCSTERTLWFDCLDAIDLDKLASLADDAGYCGLAVRARAAAERLC